MIHKGRDASEKRREIEEDERQTEMARLAARRRRSNLDKLVTLKKGNHAVEAYVKRLKKSFIQKRERLLRRAP